MALSITIAFAKQAEKVLLGGHEGGGGLEMTAFLGAYFKKHLSHS
jgi:hypothetical protein